MNKSSLRTLLLCSIVLCILGVLNGNSILSKSIIILLTLGFAFYFFNRYRNKSS